MATGFKLDFVVINAFNFLQMKLRDHITQSGVPALAAILVRDQGKMIISGQQGIRKLGASGPDNEIQLNDRFPLGSVTKPFTGTLMAKLVADGVFGNSGFSTTLLDIFPELPVVSPAMFPQYRTTTMDQLLAHVSGMPYNACQEPAGQWLDPNQLTVQNLMERRTKFVYVSVLDKPNYDCKGKEVGPFTYGGGTIICGAMAERKTGTVWEQLIQQHIYTPLGMNHSGWGVASPGGLTGPWLHGWDANNLQVTVDEASQQDSANYSSHAPAGNLYCSAADLGLYLQEQLIANPKLTSVEMRRELQTHQVDSAGDFTRGSWESSNPGSDTAELTKNGWWGVSFALVSVNLQNRVALGAISTISDVFSVAVVNDMFDTMRAMDANWTAFFESGPSKAVESVHPMPAVTLSSADSVMAFGRRRDGAFLRRSSLDGGSSWQAPIEFPAGVFTSGVAACASSDGQTLYVAGRGTDNQIWYGRSSNGGASWEGFFPISGGTFQSGAAITGAGGIVHVFATGMDCKIYHSSSSDGGKTWFGWEAIGAGVFTSGPAAAASADGRIVHVFGRGNDFRIWHNTSIHAGVDWNQQWAPIGKGVFISGPAAAASAGGTVIHVCARGTDRNFWRNKSITNGANWQEHWQTINGGVFVSAPGMSTDESGNRVYTCGLATDFTLWANSSQDAGDNWGTWSQIWGEMFI